MDGIGGWDGVGEVGVVGDERGGWRKAAPHPGSSPRPEMSLPWFLGKRGNARIEPGFQVQNISKQERVGQHVKNNLFLLSVAKSKPRQAKA